MLEQIKKKGRKGQFSYTLWKQK